jgi:hypothetical protein
VNDAGELLQADVFAGGVVMPGAVTAVRVRVATLEVAELPQASVAMQRYWKLLLPEVAATDKNDS